MRRKGGVVTVVGVSELRVAGKRERAGNQEKREYSRSRWVVSVVVGRCTVVVVVVVGGSRGDFPSELNEDNSNSFVSF